jgi:hypothetical protein
LASGFGFELWSRRRGRRVRVRTADEGEALGEQWTAERYAPAWRRRRWNAAGRRRWRQERHAPLQASAPVAPSGIGGRDELWRSSSRGRRKEGKVVSTPTRRGELDDAPVVPDSGG